MQMQEHSLSAIQGLVQVTVEENDKAGLELRIARQLPLKKASIGFLTLSETSNLLIKIICISMVVEDRGPKRWASLYPMGTCTLGPSKGYS